MVKKSPWCKNEAPSSKTVKMVSGIRFLWQAEEIRMMSFVLCVVGVHRDCQKKCCKNCQNRGIGFNQIFSYFLFSDAEGITL